MLFNDTIAAIATPPGEGGICIIRLSGSSAVAIADKIFSKNLSDAETHTLHFGKILRSDGSVIDQALAGVMLAPKSYTGENVVELSCHGGVLCAKEVLLRCIEAGARFALAGEYTKRAFLNGKLDLSQAEAVTDIINSKSEMALEAGVNQLEGALSKRINDIRDELMLLMASIGAEADFPDEGVSDIDETVLTDKLNSCISLLDELLSSAREGKIAKDGISAVIAGCPNAGKSSIFNALLQRSRAIVTDIPGTTRDTIEECIQIDGALFKFIDTAGIRNTDNAVEKIGVNLAYSSLDSAELVIFAADLSRPPCADDIEISGRIKSKKVILVLNKTDILSGGHDELYKKLFPRAETVYTCASSGEGINLLKQTISRMFALGGIMPSNKTLLYNTRHIEAVTRAKESLILARDAFKAGTPLDFTAIDIENALNYLGSITGSTVSEEIVDKIFSEFCVGK